MAQVLPKFDWSKTSKHTDNARSRSYPWGEWLDGRIRRLTQGEDFDLPATSMERVIRTSANREDKKVRIRVEGDTVVFQAHTDDARNTPRGVTRSPSKAALDAAAGNGPVKAPAKRVSKVVSKATKPSVNGNAGKPTKRPAKRIVAKVGG